MQKLPISEKDLGAVLTVLLTYVQHHDPDCQCELLGMIEKVLDKLEKHFSNDSRFSHLFSVH